MRIIHQLSYPNEDSKLFFIDPTVCAVKYPSIDEPAGMISKLGDGSLLLSPHLGSYLLQNYMFIYISAISYHHKIMGALDNTRHFIVTKSLVGGQSGGLAVSRCQQGHSISHFNLIVYRNYPFVQISMPLTL